MAISIARRLFNVSEYERLGDAGILTEDDRVELIEGEIITMSPIGKRHIACVNRLNDLLVPLVRRDAIVSVQNPVRLSEHSEPEPDIALLRRRADYYVQEVPTADDVLLIVEVSETSFDYDRAIKTPLYARAAILELWLIDLGGERILQHSRPMNNAYAKLRELARGDTIISVALPNLRLSVDEILG